MSLNVISDLIFGGADHYITSPYGARNVISTSGGKTSSFHKGVDFGTYNKKIPQYAVADGYVFAAQTASDGAKYVWLIYPGMKLAMLHYHLDKISVKAGQSVHKGTIIGKTGKTGKATGIHLHLGVKDLKDKLTDRQISNMTWTMIRSVDYIDPAKGDYSIKTESETPDSFFPARGYFMKGDVSPNVGKIARFMRKCFPKYTPASALGNIYGKHLIKAVTQFQINTGLDADGCFGKKTLAKLKDYGFKP